MVDANQLYWAPFGHLYHALQSANRSSLTQLQEQLTRHHAWLLGGLTRFGRPNDASAAAVTAGATIRAPAWGRKHGFNIDKQLASATLELARLLDLDELQCHLLLKRWIKETGTTIQPPRQQQPAAATPTPPAAGALALPAPAAAPAAGSSSTSSSASSDQAVLPAEVVQGVAEAYAQERIYLAKCQQYIIMAGMDVTADVSQTCRDELRKLLQDDWAAKAFDTLTAALQPRLDAAAAGSGGSSSKAGGATAELAHVVKPPDLEPRLHLHQLQERCELMCLMTQLFAGWEPCCAHSSHALSVLEAATLDGRPADEAVSASLDEVAGLTWPACSEDNLLKLLQLLWQAVFVPGAGVLAAERHAAWAGSASSQAVHVQQLAEALACSLILAALRPGQLLKRLSDAAAGRAGASDLGRGLSPFRQWRSIEAALMQWRPVVPGCVSVLLTVSAYNQLLASYRGTADALSSTIQEGALRAGGFAALAAPLALEELSGRELAGGLHRGLLLQGLSLMCAAFDPSPWRLPAEMLSPLISLIGDVVQGCPLLAQQIWDESVTTTIPLRQLLEQACAMFPAFPAPFLQLAAGLCQGPAAARACYSYLCAMTTLVVEYEEGAPGVAVGGGGATASVVAASVPWPKAPDVIGTQLPEGIQGSILPLPEFARAAAAAAAAVAAGVAAGRPNSSNGGGDGRAQQAPGSFLVAWEVQAEAGTGLVLLLSRAAHCLQQLHAANAARQGVADTDWWQDLRLILGLVAALLRAEPPLALALLGVSTSYRSSTPMDWLDLVAACLNVLPALAATPSAAGSAGARQAAAAAATGGPRPSPFAAQVLAALADALTAATATASCQPGRALAALGSCQLFDGACLSAQPLPLVSLEGLAAWVQSDQQAAAAGAAAADWSSLDTLQALQEALEVPGQHYPLTNAVVTLTCSLLFQSITWGIVPSLVNFTLQRVLGSLPSLPFASAAAKWELAAEALATVRAAITAGCVAVPGAAGPKAAGPPGGLMVTVLSARVIHHLATAGHGYLSAALPPAAGDLSRLSQAARGGAALQAAGSSLAEQALLLVPLLLAAVSHLSPEAPLQHYWGSEPPGGGLSPAAIIASYAAYPYGTHLQPLALEALNAFAILQAAPAAAAAAAGGGWSCSVALQPGAGGPQAPLGPGLPGAAAAAAGVGPLPGLLQSGLSRLQHHHQRSAGARGGAGGWWRPSGLFAALLAALPGLRAALLQPLQAPRAAGFPDWAIKSMALLEAGARFHPEILDSMCFPSGLSLPAAAAAAADGPAAAAADQAGGGGSSSKAITAAGAGGAAAAAGGSGGEALSALDGVWQLLQAAPELMQSDPRLLAAVLRLLAVLWECQSACHGAVELLRGQPGFWRHIQACCPAAGGALPATPGPAAAAGAGDEAVASAADNEAAAWQLQVQTCALHILLLELLSVQVHGGSSAAAAAAAAPAAAAAGGLAAAGGAGPLLAALGPVEVSQLLLAASGLGLQQPLVEQLMELLQVSYLQLGANCLSGAWGPAAVRADSLSIAGELRGEVAPLAEATARGEFSVADLSVACAILAKRGDGCSGGVTNSGNDADVADVDMTGGGGDGGARGRVLVDALSARPFGRVLLGYAAVTPGSWGAGETEYGSKFLFDWGRLESVLGPYVVEEVSGAAALGITLEDVSAAASVAHARLALLQAAASLFASLGRFAPARKQLMSVDVSRQLLRNTVQAVDRAMAELIRLSSSPAARLLSAPWGLAFIAHASSTALLLAARSMLLAVRVWKVAAAAAAADGSGRSGGNSGGNSGRPVLAARNLNQQQLLFGDAGRGKAAGSDSSGGGGSAAGEAAAIAAAAKCAGLLSRWLRGVGGAALSAATAAGAVAGDVSGAAAANIEVVECLCTSLLLMLQALPSMQQLSAAAGGPGGGSNGSRGSSSSRAQPGSPSAAGRPGAGTAAAPPAELLELESALLDLVPVLCKVCALAVDKQQQQQQQGSAAGSSASRQAFAAAMLQLLIEILQHQLPAAQWLGPVSEHLALVPMLAAAAARAGSSSSSSSLAASGPAAADGFAGQGQLLGETASGVSVTDISVLELTLAVAQVPDCSLQLWQQGLVPVLVAYCRQLLHTADQTGLMDAASLGVVGPVAAHGNHAAASAAAAALGGGSLPAHLAVSVSTLGAYAAAAAAGGGGSGASLQASVQTAGAAGGVCVWSPQHQQWCLLLGLLGTLLQQLSRSVKPVTIEEVAMQLLLAAEPRLLLAVQLQSCRASSHASAAAAAAAASGQLQQQVHQAGGGHSLLSLAAGFSSALNPGGFGAQDGAGSGAGVVTLALGSLLEAQRSLWLLNFLVPHLGMWQLQRPGSLTAFRAAAASLVEFAAAPSLDRSFRLSCPPLSPFERRLARLPSGLEPSDGWFKAAAAGGADQLPLPGQAAAGGAAGIGGGADGGASGGELALQSLSGGAAGGGVAVAGGGGCSEFSGRLCEALYSSTEAALAFLLGTAPEVDPAEVAAAAGPRQLGPMWPSAKALAALQDQVLAVGMSMIQHPQAISPRRRRVAACCCRIAAAAGRLHAAVSPARWAAAAAGGAVRPGEGAAGVAAEQAARRAERLASIQRAL